jgi:hypothetical protein
MLASKVKVKLFLCFHWAPRPEGVWGSRGIAPCIFDLGTRWRWVFRFTLRPLYSQGKSYWYPLGRRLGGPQSRSGHGGERKISSTAGTRTPNHSVRSPALYRWVIPDPVLESNRHVTPRSRVVLEKPILTALLCSLKADKGIFLFSTASRPALGPIQPPIKWVAGALAPWVKRPGRESDHSLPSSVVVKKA